MGSGVPNCECSGTTPAHTGRSISPSSSTGGPLRSFAERSEHAAGGGAVNQDLVGQARVAGGDHVRLSIEREPDMADKALVEDGVNFALVVDPALRKAPDLGACSGGEGFHNDLIVAR